MILPEPKQEWEHIAILDRCLAIRGAYCETLKSLKSKRWLREAEANLGLGKLSWELLNADYYRTFPETHIRARWFNAQWGVLFNSFLSQIRR